MTQNKLIIDTHRKIVKKIAQNPIQEVQLLAEKTVYSYAKNFNSVPPTNIKLPELLGYGKNYLVIPYLPYSNKNLDPIIIGAALIKLWNFFAPPGKGIHKRTIKLEDILRGEDLNDKDIKSILSHKRRDLEYISGNYTNIIHRDLHPDHFRKDEKGNVYIIDFGTAVPGLIEEDLAIFLLNLLSWRKSSTKKLKEVLSFFSDLLKVVGLKYEIGDLNKIFAIYSIIRAKYSKNYYDRICWLNIGISTLETNFVNPYSVPIPAHIIKGTITMIEWGIEGGVKSYIDTLTSSMKQYQKHISAVRLGYMHYKAPNSSKSLDVILTSYEKTGFKRISKDKFIEIIRKSDIVNVHNYQLGILEEEIAQRIMKLPKPTIWTVHGLMKPIFKNILGYSKREIENSPYVIAEYNLLIRADKIILNSYLLRELKQEYGKIPLSKIVLAEPATDIWKYKALPKEVEDLRKKLRGSKKDIFLILYHGRITSHKGLMELIMAVSELDSVKLILAGPLSNRTLEDSIVTPSKLIGVDERTIQDVRNTMRMLLNNDKLIYLGNVKDKYQLAKLIQASHIVIQPTHYDSFNLALLEALVLGTPILTTKIAAPEFYYNSVAIRADWSPSFDLRVSYLKHSIEVARENYEYLKNLVLDKRRYFIVRHHPINLVNTYVRVFQELLETKR